MIIDDLKYARAVGAPLVAIATADQPSMIKTLAQGLNGAAPLLVWDCVTGIRGLNERGAEARQLLAQKGFDDMALTDASAALVAAGVLPAKSVLLMQNAHRTLERTETIQALMNLRDEFKNSRRTVVLLGPAFTMPAELTQDVLILDEPLPDDPSIRAILTGLWSANGIEATPETLDRSADALRGLAGFPIEQAAALSLKPDKSIDLASLWARKRKMIEQVKGLSMEAPGETFDAIGGLKQAKEFATRLFAGPRRPRVVVFIDEIEKSLAGASGPLGDSSGTSQDALGVLLSEMEDRHYSGKICVGPAGSGKSMIARAIASTHDVPCIRLDLGAMKGSLVGQSEQQIRAAMKAVSAIAGDGGAFFIATCNRLDSLPPELRRRFRFGLWFYDLPDMAERKSIGALHFKRLKLDPMLNRRPEDNWQMAEGWSGANIRDCCELAYAMQCSLKDASKFIVPAAMQDPQGLDRLRTMATGRFLSASYPGPYQMPKPATVATAPRPARKINLEDNN